MSYIGNGVGRSQIVAGQIGNGAVGYDQLGVSATNPMTQFKNKIINGDFRKYERGTTWSAATGQRYVADQWYASATGSTVAAAPVGFTQGQTEVPGNPWVFERITVATVAGASNNVHFAQPMENAATFSGETVTASFWAKADGNKSVTVEFTQHFGSGGSPSAQVQGIGSTKINLTTSWQKFTITTAIPSVSGKTFGTTDSGALILLFWLDAGSSLNTRTQTLGQQNIVFDISRIQVERGTEATPFEEVEFGVLEAMCARYCQKHRIFTNTGPAANYVGHSTALRARMYKSPTLTYTDDVGNATKITTNAQGNNQTISGGGVQASDIAITVDILTTPGAPGNWVAFQVTLEANIL